jgi:hypothetical protein
VPGTDRPQRRRQKHAAENAQRPALLMRCFVAACVLALNRASHYFADLARHPAGAVFHRRLFRAAAMQWRKVHAVRTSFPVCSFMALMMPWTVFTSDSSK